MTPDQYNQLVNSGQYTPDQLQQFSNQIDANQTNAQPTAAPTPTQAPTNTDPTQSPFLNTLYNGLLGRNVENSTGSASYLPMDQNFGNQAVANSIMKSPEFGSTTVSPAVSSLYQSLLGRGTDPTGLSSWTSNTQNNGIRNTIQGIENSPEAQVKNDYLTYLGRDPTSSDLSSGMSLLGSGGASNQGLIDQLKSSPAYQAIPSIQQSVNQQSGSENQWKGQQAANLTANQYDASNTQALQQATLAQQQAGLNKLRAQGPQPGNVPFIPSTGGTSAPQAVTSGGGGGSSLICTELLRQGRLDKSTQVILARHMLQYPDKWWRGYWMFAGPVSWVMKRNKFISKAMEIWFKAIGNNGISGRMARGTVIGLSVFFSLFAQQNKHPAYEEMLKSGRLKTKGV